VGGFLRFATCVAHECLITYVPGHIHREPVLVVFILWGVCCSGVWQVSADECLITYVPRFICREAVLVALIY